MSLWFDVWSAVCFSINEHLWCWANDRSCELAKWIWKWRKRIVVSTKEAIVMLNTHQMRAENIFKCCSFILPYFAELEFIYFVNSMHRSLPLALQRARAHRTPVRLRFSVSLELEVTIIHIGNTKQLRYNHLVILSKSSRRNNCQVTIYWNRNQPTLTTNSLTICWSFRIMQMCHHEEVNTEKFHA